MAGIKSYENKYGITVTNDSFTNPLTGKYQKRYKILYRQWLPVGKRTNISGTPARDQDISKYIPTN